MQAKIAEERQADFARYLADPPAKSFPKLPADRETWLRITLRPQP